MSNEWFIVIFVSPEESHILKSFLSNSKIRDSEGFLKYLLSDASELIQKMTTNSSSIEERLAYKELIGSSEENLLSAKKLIENFIHVKWHTVFDFWFNLQSLIINDNSFELTKPFDKDIIDTKKTNDCIRDITHYEVYRKGQREKQKCEILFNLKEGVDLKIKYSAITNTFYFGIPKIGNEPFKEVADKLLAMYDEYEVNLSKNMFLYKVFNNNIHFNNFSRKETFMLINSDNNRQASKESFYEVKKLANRIMQCAK